MITPVELALELNARVLAFAGSCVAVVIAFGLWPCTRPARSAGVSSVSQSDEVGRSAAARRALAGRVMLVAQLAMCTILMIGAGLLLRTVTNLRSQELGFDRNALLMSVSPRQAGYSNEAAAMLLQRIARAAIGRAGHTGRWHIGPYRCWTHYTYWIDGSQLLTTDRGVVLPGARWTFAAVGPGFFEAVGMSVVDGRGFDAAAPPGDSVVVNQFAGDVSLRRDERDRPADSAEPARHAASRSSALSTTRSRRRRANVAWASCIFPCADFGQVVLAVRTAGNPAEAVPVVRHQLAALAGDLQIEKVRTIAAVLDEAIAQERLMSAIALILSALAIAIGCVGLYALMSYVVARRTHELGIRLALGATSKKVVTMVLRDSAALILPGLAIGVPLGIAASQPLSSQLFDVQTNDPWTLASVALVLCGRWPAGDAQARAHGLAHRSDCAPSQRLRFISFLP